MNSIRARIHDFFSPVLSDQEILKRIEKGELISPNTPISDYQLQPNSVDLTLGHSVRVLCPNARYNSASVIDPAKHQNYMCLSFEHQYKIGADYSLGSDRPILILEPQQFVLMASREILDIPNGIISFVQGRSSIARLAIQTEQAGLIDAGFRGTITFEVYNQAAWPVILYEGMRVAQVYFFKAQYAKALYGKEKSSKYYGQIEATGSRVNHDAELHQPFEDN